MKDLRKADGEYRALRDKKLMQKVIDKPSEEDLGKKEEREAAIQKTKVLTRIADNKVTQMKMKIMSQKKNNDDLDKEIEEVRKTIEEKVDLNERLSKRVKELLSNSKLSEVGKNEL